MEKVNLKEEVVKALKEEAEEAYNEECCGFLFGHEEQERNIVVAWPVENKMEDGRRRFEIGAEDYMKAEEKAEQEGLQLLGVYHSHPDHPAIPSQHDHKQAMPYFSYVIISVGRGTAQNIRSWQLNENNEFQEEDISYTFNFKKVETHE